jgi:hypothetical protein
MRSPTWLGSWLCALLLTVAFSRAAAQGPAPVPPVQGDPPGYRELVDEAVTEHRAGHFGEARALFARAHNLYPNARTLKGLGMAEFELRNYRESAQYLEASLASTVKPLTPELRSEAEQLLARAQRFLGKVRVLVSPSSTQITVDGTTAPFGADGSVLLVAGDHVLEATAIGHEPARQTIKINGGDDQTVTFQLTPIATPAGATPPPTAAPPAAAVAAAPPPEAGVVKPGGFRLYFGGLFGFAGRQDLTFEVQRNDGATGSIDVSSSQKVTYGFDLGATFFAIPFFDLGAEVRLSWAKAGAIDDDGGSGLAGMSVDTGRTLLVDLDVKPRLRFDLLHGKLELYVAVPVGLTIPSRPKADELDTSLGWNIGVGPGVTYFLSEHVGLDLELMFLFHSYSADGSTEQDGSTLDATITLFSWQPSALLNLVIAP